MSCVAAPRFSRCGNCGTGCCAESAVVPRHTDRQRNGNAKNWFCMAAGSIPPRRRSSGLLRIALVLRDAKRLVDELDHALPHVIPMPWFGRRTTVRTPGERAMILARIGHQFDWHAFLA